tara:strand:- start:618 stop:1247 length:630 start_codon:yes stop_codon:yes gene_type:complete
MDSPDFKIIKPFGPSIVKVKIPNNIVNEMNKYVDKIISDEEKLKNLDHSGNLAGQVKQEFKLERDFMEKIKWGEFLGVNVGKWLFNETGKKLKSFDIKQSWIIRQFKDEYNPVHTHSGHVSGVGYLKVPESFGISKPNKINNKGCLNLIHGSINLFCKSQYVVRPEVGDFYFFPNYLMHTVYPFTDTQEERRSVSFNAKLDDEAANIFI